MFLILFSRIRKRRKKTTENIDDSQSEKTFWDEKQQKILSVDVYYMHIPTQTSTSISWKAKTHVNRAAVLGKELVYFFTSFQRNIFVPLTVPALAYIHTHIHTHIGMTSRKQRCLRSFSSAFWAPSSMEFETMPLSSAKNSLHHETVAQEIFKIFAIDWVHTKNSVFDGTTTAQKEARLFGICHCVCDTRNFMSRRTIRNWIKCRMFIAAGEFSTFCATETGIWTVQE